MVVFQEQGNILMKKFDAVCLSALKAPTHIHIFCIQAAESGETIDIQNLFFRFTMSAFCEVSKNKDFSFSI